MNDAQPTRRIEIQYEVKRPFMYNGELLKPGDEFVPRGGPHDAKLINQGKYVQRIETAVIDAEEARHQKNRYNPKRTANNGK